MSEGQQHRSRTNSGGGEGDGDITPPLYRWSSSIACCWPSVNSLVYGPGLLFRGPICIILESTPRFSKWYLSVRPLIQNAFMHFFFLPYMLHALPHVILLDLSTRVIFGEEYSSWSSSLCSFLHSPVISSLLSPNILLSTRFSITLNLRSSLTMTE